MQTARYTLGMDGVDAFGIIYFAHYWTWYQQTLERALESTGHPIRDLLASGIGIPTVHAAIDYRHPLRLSDEVHVTLSLMRIDGRKLHFRGEFRDAPGRLTAEAETIHLVTGPDLQPVDVPSWFGELLEAPPTDD